MLDIRIEDSLTNRLVLAEDVRNHDHVRLHPTDEIFAVWDVKKNDFGCIVIKGCYMNEDEAEYITVASDHKVRLFAYIRENHDADSHCLSIQPVGFWSDVITVRKNKSFGRENFSDCEMNWSSGGTTGQFSSAETATMFIEALEYAKDWAEKADRKYK